MAVKWKRAQRGNHLPSWQRCTHCTATHGNRCVTKRWLTMYFFLFPSFLFSFLPSLFPSFFLPSLSYRYKEVCKFNFKNPEGNSRGTLHFTQVVWKKSLTLGIGKADKGGCTYVVARYRPFGNVRSQFKMNVAKGTFNEGGSCRGGREWGRRRR